MKHRGEIVKKVLELKGTNLTWLAKELKVTTRSLYNWFETSDLPLEKIVKVGLAIDYEFAQEFPDLAKFFPKKDTEKIDYKAKYFELLEKTNQLFEEKLNIAADPKSGYGKKKRK